MKAILRQTHVKLHVHVKEVGNIRLPQKLIQLKFLSWYTGVYKKGDCEKNSFDMNENIDHELGAIYSWCKLSLCFESKCV